MRFVSWNVNGIRAVANKGLLESLNSLEADVIGFQETKATEEQVAEVLQPMVDAGWHLEASSAERKGYSGTAMLSRQKPLRVLRELPQSEHNSEGRLIAAEFDDHWAVTAYVPNSGGELARLPYRSTWDKDLTAFLTELDKEKPVFFGGDLNVAHQPMDIARPKANYNKTPGYTQVEIDGFTQLLQAGFVDTFRTLHPDRVEYSWWSYRGGARENNIGWRLDYWVVSQRMANRLEAARIHPGIAGSDHVPVSVDWK
jgi:exodeoxyribonuclease-3